MFNFQNLVAMASQAMMKKMLQKAKLRDIMLQCTVWIKVASSKPLI